MSTRQTGTVTLLVDDISHLREHERTVFTFAGLSFFGIRPHFDIQYLPQDNLYLYWLYYDGVRVKVHFNVSILSASADKLYTLEYNFEFDGANRYAVVTFISRAKLLDPQNGYLVDDRLTLLCEAEIIQDNVVSVPPRLRFQQDLNNLSENLQSLLNDAKFSDVTLTVGLDGNQFNVHKNILAARSPVFAAMFEHDCEEKRQNEVKITDIDAETCDELLRYIYTGKVKQMDRYALDLWQAADKYQMDSLKNICEHFLCWALSTETVVNVLLVAELHRAAKLKNKCLEYIFKNSNQMRDTEGWKLLESNGKLFSDLYFYATNNKKK